MDLLDLGKKLVALGAPVIGAALGGPLGGAAAKVLADAIGAPSEAPDVIAKTIEATPAPVVQEKVSQAESQWAEAVKANAELAKVQVQEVNKTMRAELAATPNGWWGRWREWLAIVLVAECVLWPILIAFCIVTGRVDGLVLLSALIMTWWAARFGAIGVHVWTGSHERRTAMTGQTSDSAIAAAIKAITGKR